MDLRTIINNDSSTSQNPPVSTPRRTSGSDQECFQSGGPHSRHSGSPVLPPPQDQRVRPPQPPPLQPPQQSPGSISYGSAQSPYQSNSASTLSGGGLHSQGPQQLPPPLQPSRESAGYGPPQQGPVLSSPFTPHPISAGMTQSYFSQPRSAIHSATTPTSTRSYSYAAPPPIRRDSTNVSQQTIPPPQTYSPTQQQSQPGTPMARPLNAFPQPSPHSARPLSSGRDGQALTLASPWTTQEPQRRDQMSVDYPAAPPSLSRHNTYPQPAFIPEKQRDQALSVSPKAASMSLGNSQHDASRESSLVAHSVQHNRTSSGETNWRANNGATTLNSHPHEASSPSQTLPPTTPKATHPSAISPQNPTISPPHSKQPSLKDMSPPPPPNPQPEVSAPPRKKRKRYAEPPIFAQLAPRTSGTRPAIPNKPLSRPSSLPPKPPPRTTDRFDAKSQANTPRRATPAAPAPNGNPVNGNVPAQSLERKDSILGPWEPSITGLIPHEEVTKVICDFLFEHVVLRKDIGAGPAGAATAGAGAVLQVEAKLGQLVDRNRGTRLQLPVYTETVLSREDPSLRIAFESSMSLVRIPVAFLFIIQLLTEYPNFQAQHRVLNNFLNDTVKATMAPGTSRIPVTYAHKKERDSFYEIDPKALPPLVQHHLNPRHKPKVRVTTDQRTGAVLARIIKCRIADLDVYSPRTCLDWRISVNLEMNYDGDLGELIPTDREDMGGGGQRRGGGARGDRNKDRMSYRHLAYQIDLTQVASSDVRAYSFLQLCFKQKY